MLRISPINNINFSSQPTRNKDDNKNSLKTGLAAAAAVGITTIALTRGRTKSFEKLFIENGIHFQNEVAIVKATGEKFTGTLKRNVKPFGLKKETMRFENGIITEKVCHNALGRELGGIFYKNGKPYLSIEAISSKSKDKINTYKYAKFSEGFDISHQIQEISGFEWARNKIKNGTI